MHLLSDILATLKLEATLYFRADLGAPFSVAVPEDPRVIRFHAASAGACWVKLSTGEAVRLESGDLVLVPHGAAHVLADADGPAQPLDQVMSQAAFDGRGPLVYGAPGGRTVLVCGHFGFAHRLMHPVISTLPPLMHLRGTTGRFEWLEQLLAFLRAEASDQATGWDEVVQRLAEVVFILILREYSGCNPHSTGALAALADARLGAALRALHADPAAAWSLEALARQAAMSKTVFVEQFKAAMGMTPGKYVSLWRMHKARALLERGDLDVAQVAERVGYSSEAAFHRVFRAAFGLPPGRYRRQHDDTR